MQKRRWFEEYVKPLLLAALIALVVRTFLVQAFHIPSGSMEPSLLVGDYLLVTKFNFGIEIPYTDMRLFADRKPQRGDVIVFLYPVNPSMDFIKRVIGTGGEKVQIIQNRIYINDEMIPDPWGYFKRDGLSAEEYESIIENFGPVVVPQSTLFVMGDNRDNSLDSRFWGFLPLKDVVGKALIIYFSWDSRAENPWGKVRWSRIGKVIR